MRITCMLTQVATDVQGIGSPVDGFTDGWEAPPVTSELNVVFLQKK